MNNVPVDLIINHILPNLENGKDVWSLYISLPQLKVLTDDQEFWEWQTVHRYPKFYWEKPESLIWRQYFQEITDDKWLILKINYWNKITRKYDLIVISLYIGDLNFNDTTA